MADNSSKGKKPQARLGFLPSGPVSGPGTGTSDSIEADVPPGSFVMPADSSQALGLGVRGIADARQPAVPVRVSNGENVIPPQQVYGLGVRALMNARDATHQPAPGLGFNPEIAAAYRAQQQQRRGPGFGLFFADGGVVDDWRSRNPLTSGVIGAGKTALGVLGAPAAKLADTTRELGATVLGADPNSLPGGRDRYSNQMGSLMGSGVDQMSQAANNLQAAGRSAFGLKAAPAATAPAVQPSGTSTAPKPPAATAPTSTAGAGRGGYGMPTGPGTSPAQQVADNASWQDRRPAAQPAAAPTSGFGLGTAEDYRALRQPAAALTSGFGLGTVEDYRALRQSSQPSGPSVAYANADGTAQAPQARDMDIFRRQVAQDQAARLAHDAEIQNGNRASQRLGATAAALMQQGNQGDQIANANQLGNRQVDASVANANTQAATQRYGTDMQTGLGFTQAGIDAYRASQDAALKGAGLGIDASRANADIARTGAETQRVQQDVSRQSQIADLVSRINKETNPQTREQLTQQWRMLAGVAAPQDQYQALTVGGGVDPATGLARPQSVAVVNKATGQVVNQGGQGGQTQAQPLPSKDKLVSGQTYQTARGPARWDGKQFVPI